MKSCVRSEENRPYRILQGVTCARPINEMANETFLSGHISTPTTNQTPVMGLTCWSRNASVDYLYTCIVPSPGEWILIGAYIVTFLVGVLGNILVCFAVWRNNEMRTETNIYMVNLSLADLTVLIVLLPSALLVDVTGTWFLGFAMCKISIALGVSYLIINIPMLSLCAELSYPIYRC